MIDEVLETTRSAGGEIAQISEVIVGVDDIIATIATAFEEQTATTQEIANNIPQASMGIQEVNENVSQSSMVAGTISEDISEVSKAVKSISDSNHRVKGSSEDLLAKSRDLNEIACSFKV